MKNSVITGVISTTRKGAGYVDDADPKKPSIYIEAGLLNTALNGDTVEVSFSEKMYRGVKQPMGEVLRVISRDRTTFVGTVEEGGNGLIISPDDKKVYVNFSIEKGQVSKSDKVYFRMTDWSDPKQLPTAEVLRILGKKGDNDVEMEAIVLGKGFEFNYPPEVEAEAHDISLKIAEEEIAKRRDMRKVPTFTIDPYDAKDFDDAISFQKLSDGTYEIGVHIADVSHYVREGSALDAEAAKRGCSIYLVDRTIPMLPEVLSNDVCSLNPHEDKLSFSAVFIMDDKGQVKSRWFGKTVMNSIHRFTYETAQAAIDNVPENVVKYSNSIQKAESAESGLKYRETLVTLNNIAKILQKEKFSHGAIEFEQEEIKFKLDEKGKPIGVYRKERLDTHKLVEEYMLLANREVAKYIFDAIKNKGTRDTGSIYRIHDVPDKEKIMNLATFVKALGYTLNTKDGAVTAHDLNHLLEQIENTPHESLVRTAVIRSMQKAIYSTKNIGHFGLAFPFYTHFTSPIRRYPDLLVHRVLSKHLNNEPFAVGEINNLQHMAETSTRREIDAADAERSSKKLKQVEYMSQRIGQVFEGAISGVAKWGIYIEENESRSEGMVPIRNLGNDYFNFEEKTYSMVGEKTKKRFTLGDKVKFKVVSADLDQRVVEYALV
jgi:ribonuclease R